jgi:hypothetical protein
MFHATSFHIMARRVQLSTYFHQLYSLTTSHSLGKLSMDLDQVKTKRRRSLTPSSSSSSSTSTSTSRSPSQTPPPKFHRSAQSSTQAQPHLCTLPPTCSQPDTTNSFATLAELERHQEAFHRWVCRVPIRNRAGERDKGRSVEPIGGVPERFVGREGMWEYRECGKVFPDETFLVLVSHDIFTCLA